MNASKQKTSLKEKDALLDLLDIERRESMKQTKMDVTLSEKDALQDMLDIEKLLMSYYNYALTEGSSKSFRKEILKNLSSHAETQYSVFEQMLNRGYYEVQPAEQALIQKQSENYSKVYKQIQSN